MYDIPNLYPVAIPYKVFVKVILSLSSCEYNGLISGLFLNYMHAKNLEQIDISTLSSTSKYLQHTLRLNYQMKKHDT